MYMRIVSQGVSIQSYDDILFTIVYFLAEEKSKRKKISSGGGGSDKRKGKKAIKNTASLKNPPREKGARESQLSSRSKSSAVESSSSSDESSSGLSDCEDYVGASFKGVKNSAIPCSDDISDPFNPNYCITMRSLYSNPETKLNLEGTYILATVLHVIKSDTNYSKYRLYGGGGGNKGRSDKPISEDDKFDRMIIVSDMCDQSDGRCGVIFFHTIDEAQKVLGWFRAKSRIVKGSLVAIKEADFRDTFFGENEDMVVLESLQSKSIIPLDEDQMKYIWEKHPGLGIHKELAYVSTRMFFLKNIFVKMRRVNIEAGCSGVMCDRGSHKSSSCFCTSKDSPRNFVLCCQVGLYTDKKCSPNNLKELCDDFKSLRFTEFIFGPVRTKGQSVESMRDSVEKEKLKLTRMINKFLYKHNKHGGFHAIGWYKLGKTSDKMAVSSNVPKGQSNESKDVIAETVNPHLIRLIPVADKPKWPKLLQINELGFTRNDDNEETLNNTVVSNA